MAAYIINYYCIAISLPSSWQLYVFAQTKFYVTDFLNENSQTFSKLFVANPVDTSLYQNDPVSSPVAYLYTMDEILDQINFTASAVSFYKTGAL